MDGGAVGLEGSNEWSNGTLFHSSVACDDGSLVKDASALDERADGGEEAGGGASVTEVKFFSFRGDREAALASHNLKGIAVVLPAEFSSLRWEM
jgi:hypothetical protein